MEANESEVGRGAALTQSLLRCGVWAGPFYLAVGLTQALLRDGFDLARHPLSVLANGPFGWVQIANFVLSGLMVLAAAIGFGRVLGPKSRAVAWFLGGYGVSMIVAAMFRADPVDGFPPGTPTGPPTSISTTGLIHFIAGSLGFTFLGISCFFAARRCGGETGRHWHSSRFLVASPSCWDSSAALCCQWESWESGLLWSSGGRGSPSWRSGCRASTSDAPLRH